MRHVFLVTYDVSDSRRLKAIYKLMRGWGDHIQLSVFLCEINATERVELESRLDDLIQHDEDQILFIRLGLANGRGRRAIHSIGRKYFSTEQSAIVL